MHSILAVLVFWIVGMQGVWANGLWHDFKIESALVHDGELVSEKNLDLKDLVKRGLAHNQDLKMSLLEWKQALHAVVPVKSLDRPELSYAHYLDEVETRVGAQKRSVGLMQKIPFPGKLSHQGRISVQKAKQKQALYLHKKLLITAGVQQTYYEYVYVSNAIEVTQVNQKLLKDLEQVAQTKYKSGLAKNQDLLKAQVELGKIADELISLHEYQEVIASRLKSLLSWPRDRDLKMNMHNQSMVSFSEHVFRKQGLSNNKELMMIQYAIDEGNVKASLAKLNYMPDFSIGVSYIQTDRRLTDVADNGKDPLIATLKVSLPIWMNSNKEKVNGAESFKKAKEKLYAEKKNQLEARVDEVIYKIKDARRKIDLYRNALVPKADQALKTIETNYTSGHASFLDLIDSQRTLLSFQLAYYRAKANYAKALAGFHVLMGGSSNE